MTEVATFRSDGAYSDGRHPDAVRYTKSSEEDVLRRDFTINGLLLDPLCGAGFQKAGPSTALRSAQDDRSLVRAAVIDYVGGLADLEAGVIRAIGARGVALRRRPSADAARRTLCGAIRL